MARKQRKRPRKYRGKVFHLINVKQSSHGRRYVHAPNGRARYISSKHLLKHEHIKEGGGLQNFMTGLGEQLKDPSKWAIVEATTHPERYWRHQAWGLKNASGSLAYAAGKGIQTTGTLLRVPQKYLGKVGKQVLKGFGAGKAMQFFGDIDKAGQVMEPLGKALADVGAKDQEKFSRYMVDERKKERGGGLVKDLFDKLSYRGNSFKGY